MLRLCEWTWSSSFASHCVALLNLEGIIMIAPVKTLGKVACAGGGVDASGICGTAQHEGSVKACYRWS